MARFVLVHGAFGGAWSWEPIVGPLEAAGHTVETLDLPGGGDDRTPVAGVTLAACAERVVAQLLRRPDRAVLVGYSMGGVVVTQAASNCPERVASLIFMAAFMPSNGQSLVDLTRLPEGQGDLIQANIVVEGDPLVAMLPDEAAAEAIYNCCTQEQIEASVGKRRPQAVAVFGTPVSVDEAVLASIPRSYLLTRQDHAIPPALQRRMIAEHPCRRVIELDTDHAPQLSATNELVAALIDLAADTPVEAALADTAVP
jgi:pimeloyl-ACP methyl ester carboxylesterase